MTEIDQAKGLTSDDRARNVRESGLAPYGRSYEEGRSYDRNLLNAIWGSSDDEVMHDSPQIIARREILRVQRDYITDKQFFNLYKGVCFANFQGWILNVEMTIAFSHLGIIGPEAMTEAFRIWCARYRDWCSHRKIPCVYIYVWEHQGTKSLHVHLQLYVEPCRLAEFKVWVQNTIPLMSKPNAYAAHTQPNLSLRRTATVASQWYWFKYLMKGLYPFFRLGCAEQSLTQQLALRWVKPQGEISHKRVGISVSIGRKARAAAEREIHFAYEFLDGSSRPEEFWTDAYLLHFQKDLERKSNWDIASAF